MATRELGTKHVCFKCGTKFYDLKKPAPVCPKCGADQREQPVTTKAARKAATRLKAATEPEEAAEAAEEGEEGEDEEADEEDDEG